MVREPHRANKSTPGGDSEKPRTFPDGNKPRMFSNSNKRILQTETNQEQDQIDEKVQDTVDET